MRDQDTFLKDADDGPTALDRAWAATRPAELSDREFDAIWAEVQRASDSPRTLDFVPRRPSIGPRRLVVLGLASAAALCAAFVLNRPADGPAPVFVQSLPTPKVEDLKIDVDEIVIVEIAGTHVDTHRTKSDPGTTLAYQNIPADNPNDQLNHWEAMAQ